MTPCVRSTISRASSLVMIPLRTSRIINSASIVAGTAAPSNAASTASSARRSVVIPFPFGCFAFPMVGAAGGMAHAHCGGRT